MSLFLHFLMVKLWVSSNTCRDVMWRNWKHIWKQLRNICHYYADLYGIQQCITFLFFILVNYDMWSNIIHILCSPNCLANATDNSLSFSSTCQVYINKATQRLLTVISYNVNAIRNGKTYPGFILWAVNTIYWVYLLSATNLLCTLESF